MDSDHNPGLFWPAVILGTIAIWSAEWLLSPSGLYVPIGVASLAASGIVFGLVWARVGHSRLVALSWAIPLSLYWVLAFLLGPHGFVGVALYALGIGFLVAMIMSKRLVDFWYRVILRSRLPRPPTT